MPPPGVLSILPQEPPVKNFLGVRVVNLILPPSFWLLLRFGLTAPAGNVPAVLRPEVYAMVALMFRMAPTLGLLPTVITVDRLTRYPSATTLTDVRDMAPSARHPLRGYVSASHHIVPP